MYSTDMTSIRQAGDQFVIHLNPLRRTKRHAAEIVCETVNLSSSLLKYTVVHSDYCVTDEEHNCKVEFGSRTTLTPRDLFFFPGSSAERERCRPPRGPLL